METISAFINNLKEYMDGESVDLNEVTRNIEELEELITYFNN